REKEEFFRVVEEIQGDVEMWRGRVAVLGDFNSRIGELPNVMLEGEEDNRIVCARVSQDKICNTRGRFLIREMNASGLVIANGVEKEAEFTSVQNKGSAVIDLVCVA